MVFGGCSLIFDPGGVLALDYYHEQFEADHWSAWQPQPVDESPPRPENRRVGTDGYSTPPGSGYGC